MKIKKYISMILTAVILFSLIYQSDAFAAPKQIKYYLQYAKTNFVIYNKGDRTVSINIVTDLPVNQKKFKKSVKCSDAKVAKIVNAKKLQKNYTVTEIVDGKLVSKGTTTYSIELKPKKIGKTNISFKIGNKKCTTSLTVLKDRNPFKSISITGCRKGKNLSKLIKWNNGRATLNLKGGTIKNAKLKLQLTNEDLSWLARVNITDNTNGIFKNLEFNSDDLNHTFSLGTLKKGHSYTMKIYFNCKLPNNDIGIPYDDAKKTYDLTINYN